MSSVPPPHRRYALSRRGFLGGAIGGAVSLSLGGLLPAPAAAGLRAVPTLETYVALRDARSPLGTAGRAAATAEFEEWWVQCDDVTRHWVRDVFDALDRGEPGSFARAERRERAALLVDWTHPDADPLRDDTARRQLSSGIAALEIARAPQGVPDARVPV